MLPEYKNETIEARVGKKYRWVDHFPANDEPDHEVVMFKVSSLTESPIKLIQYALISDFGLPKEEAADYANYFRFKNMQENDLLKITFRRDKYCNQESLTRISPGWPQQIILFDSHDEKKGFTELYSTQSIIQIENLTQGWSI
jgi:hypothetical protein